MPEQCWADNHTHTDCSPDGLDSALVMCERACQIGFSYCTITDHCECQDYHGETYGYNYENAVEASHVETERAADQFSGRIRVLRGVELGQPLQCEAVANRVLQTDFDFVLGSVHNIANHADFYFLNYARVTEAYIGNLLTAYFQELLDTARWGKMDALSHLTYPLRYITGDHHIPVDLNRYQTLLDAILQTLIRQEIALEVNTSGLRQKLRRTLPDLPLLRRYYELGGRLATLGSDAHAAGDLGRGLRKGLQNLYEAGFREYAVYIKHTPLMLPIEAEEIYK